MSDDLAGLFTTPQIRTDTDGRHWDTAGVEYDAVTVGGELAYVPRVDVEEAPEGDPAMEAVQARIRNGGLLT